MKAEDIEMMEARIYTNVAMRAFCNDRGIEYLCSETFISASESDVVIFADDGIHLTPKGSILFQNYLEGKIGELLGISYLDHPRMALSPRPPSPGSRPSSSSDAPTTSGTKHSK
jgi:hypothetical protein